MFRAALATPLESAVVAAQRLLDELPLRVLRASTASVEFAESLPTDGPTPFLVTQRVVIEYRCLCRWMRKKVIYDEKHLGLEDMPWDTANLLAGRVTAFLATLHQ